MLQKEIKLEKINEYLSYTGKGEVYFIILLFYY
jgi:hypothetical protein